MARTATEIQADLDIINAALQELVSGNRLTRLQLGSGEFSRVYEFQDLTYDNLKQEKTELQAELDTLTATNNTMSFRKTGSLPLVVTKLPRQG